jgi:hypothetical protein
MLILRGFPPSSDMLLLTPLSQSMLLSFSLASVPVLSQDHYASGYLLRTSPPCDGQQPNGGVLTGCDYPHTTSLALLSHVFYLVFYAYTQTMIYYTLKRASGELAATPCVAESNRSHCVFHGFH